MMVQTNSRNANHEQDSLDDADGGKSNSVTNAERIKKLWLKAGLDRQTMQKMFKLSVSPTIAIAMFQSSAVANHFETTGYLIALISFASMPLLPRLRFLRSWLTMAILICLGCALGLPATWFAVQARNHTTKPDAPPEKYNSSQAAVLGIFLFFYIWLFNSLKSAYPFLQLPVLLFSTQQCAGLASGVSIQTMAQGITAQVRLLEAFLLGLAISGGTSLIIFPQSCRHVYFDALKGYFGAMKGVLATQHAYFASIEALDPWSLSDTAAKNDEHIAYTRAKAALSGAATRMRGEQEFAEKEIAYGKLDGKSISELSGLALRIQPAFSGLGFVINILANLSRQQPNDLMQVKESIEAWKDIMRALHEPFAELRDSLNLGIEHVLVMLGLQKRPVVQDKVSDCAPGTSAFIGWYDGRTRRFLETRKIVARLWIEKDGKTLPGDFAEQVADMNEKNDIHARLTPAHRRLYTIIMIQYLLFAASREIYDLILWVDAKQANGTLTKSHFIAPQSKHLKKWLTQVFSHDAEDASDSPDATILSIGTHQPMHRHKRTAPTKDHDPEHLPPSTTYEALGNQIRRIPRALRSPHSSHGLRVACAVLSVTIGFYVGTSSTWFARNRWLWAAFAIVLTMTRTAGLSLFLFTCRLLGTAAALAASFAVWYMVNGRVPGVLVFLWVFFLAVGYCVTRWPFYTSAFMVSGFAAVVMVGNELQDGKLGFERVSALGQDPHREYLMAPERLAIVSAGLAVAYFWTVFPYPLSEHTELRQDLSATLYFLASYHSMVRQTVTSRAEGYETMESRNQNPLAVQRLKTFTRLQFMFTRLKQHLTFTRWQVILGGRFPKEKYAELISLCEEVCTAMAVIGYSSASFLRVEEDAAAHLENGNGKTATRPERWLNEFRDLLGTVDSTSEEITDALVMLSNHMQTGSPFPPHTKAPEPFQMATRISDVNADLLTVTHLTEPGYAAFVTMAMAGRGINTALGRMIEVAKELVGVFDFAYYEQADELEKQEERELATEED